MPCRIGEGFPGPQYQTEGWEVPKYYMETKWNPNRGLDICWVYKRGEVKHFAVFYDKKAAEDYIRHLNKKRFL
jgi:hypothetical protein